MDSLLLKLRPLWPWLVLAALTFIGWSELRRLDVSEVRSLIRSAPPALLLALLAVTAVNLSVAGLYDVVALGPLSRAPSARERWSAGVLSFAWSNFLTIGPLAGPALRLWLYRPLGVEGDRARSALSCIMAAFSLALAACCAAAAAPLPAWLDGPLPRLALLAAASAAAVSALIVLRRTGWAPQLFRRWEANLPLLICAAVADWLLAWAVFYLSLGVFDQRISPVPVARAFFLGQMVGLVSFIPGGLGTADAFWFVSLAGIMGGHDRVAAALVLYRSIYYVLPWAFASLTLAGHLVRTGPRFSSFIRSALASYTFLTGAVLLASAATPALADRAASLHRTLPLAVVEVSHSLSVLLGFLLLLISRGIAQGYRSSHRLALVLFLSGSLATFLKGLDYEEALVALAAAALLLIFHRLFDRRGSLHPSLEFVVSAGAIALVLFSALGLGSYGAAPDLSAALTRFGVHAQAERFLRGFLILFGAASVLAVYLAQRMRGEDRLPDGALIATALEEARRYGRTTNPLLVACGDKVILRPSGQTEGFIAYRTAGPFLVAYSDPVCAPGMEREFLSAFLDLAADNDRDAILYQITPALLPAAHDFGFSFFKLGEEAIVDLDGFDLKGNKAKTWRHAINRVEKDSGRFEIVQGEALRAIMSELRAVSDAWLLAKRAGEQRFSLGRFDEPYLMLFPCAVVRDAAGGIVAFANVLEGARGEEMSVDLMRYRGDNVMDYLFIRLMLHGKQRGFKRFNLGMAPLAAVGDVRWARPIERLAHLFFRHGEHWYNYQGLRHFKEKFDPVWEPRYMAYPHPWQWPLAIAHVSALVAGGRRALVFPRTGA